MAFFCECFIIKAMRFLFEQINFVLFQLLDIFIFILPYLVYIVPFFLAYALWKIYMRYIQALNIRNTKRITLEIKIPKEISKSPMAMELFLHACYQTYEGELIDKYIKGNVRAHFSLELVSLGGEIHFFFNIPKFFKDLIESQIYSQYPEVEVFEVDDYTREVNYNLPGSTWDIAGWEWKLSKEDAYPIKTYIDYGLDKDPKEEFKIDPMTPMLEFLGSLKSTERVWYQILIMASKERFPVKKILTKPSTWFKKQDWKADAKEILEKMLKRKEEGDIMKSFTKLALSSGEKATAEAIERGLGKFGFDVGIRAIYASKEDLRAIAKVGVGNSIKQFGAPGANSFKPSLTTGFNHPWQDFRGIRAQRKKRKIFRNYLLREYFYPPAQKKPMVMTTEEIATMYHFPGLVATTPSLGRIPSKRGEPPTNLPI